MRHYVLLYLLSLFYIPALMASMIVRDVPNKDQIIQCLLRNTNLSEALFNTIIAYMNAYFIMGTLNRPMVPSAVAFSPNGQWLATATYHGLVCIWDADGIESKQVLDAHKDSIRSLVYSPDDKFLATSSYDHTARLWESKSGKSLAIFKGHEGPLNSIRFSPDGRHIITASDDEKVRLWDVETAQTITRFDRHTNWVCSASFNPDGQQFVSGGNDAMARIWDIRSNRVVHDLFGHQSDVNTVSFSPEGEISHGEEILTASDDRTVRVWDAQSGVMKRRFTLPNEIYTAYFNHVGDQILIATNSKKAYIVDAAKGDLIQELHTDSRPTISALFSQASGRIVTITRNSALQWSALYDAHQKKKFTIS